MLLGGLEQAQALPMNGKGTPFCEICQAVWTSVVLHIYQSLNTHKWLDQ